MMNKGTLTITCPNSSDEEERHIKITLVDTASRIQFLTVKMDARAFAMALTGLSFQEIEFALIGHDRVGKTLESELLQIHLNRQYLDANKISEYDRALLESTITKSQSNWVKPGWTLNPYLGSQGSISRVADGVFLNVSQRRYV